MKQQQSNKTVQHAGDSRTVPKSSGAMSIRILADQVQSLLAKHIGYHPELVWYTIGVVVRVLWTLFYPQRGYIHPDEFFQGPEIVFDDIFRANLTRTHEFHPSAPLRSVAILYLLYGLPVSILSGLSTLLNWSSVSFHLKLVLPRASILVLSLGTDVLFYRLIKLCHPTLTSKQHGTIMNFYGVSHVVLVFFTRTLSNSFEAFLFLALIYLVIDNVSSLLSSIHTPDNEPDMNILTHSRSHHLLSTDFRLTFTSASIGIICALGLFNRPTFPAFACVPLLYWLTKVFPTISHSSSRTYYRLSRTLFSIVGTFILTSILLILFDSYYYNDGFLFIINIKNSLVVCPLNFIIYNMDRTNLDQHGLHPPWLHFFVNAILLFGPLHLSVILWGLCRIQNVHRTVQTLFNRVLNIRQQPKVDNTNLIRRSTATVDPEQSMSLFFLWLYLVPFIPLSTFPHQEPRFLLPLIFPLMLFVVPLFLAYNYQRSLFAIWLIFNMIVAIVYGHLHQGGLLPALRYIHDNQSTSSGIINNEQFLVVYHTYMPPDYLVASMSLSANRKQTRTTLIDLKGASREELDKTIERIFNEHPIQNNNQVLLLLPATCRTDLVHLHQQRYHFQRLKQFGPHLDFDHSSEIDQESFHVKYAGTSFQWAHQMWNKYRLDLYQVTRG